jgi:hypothetical protein
MNLLMTKSDPSMSIRLCRNTHHELTN